MLDFWFLCIWSGRSKQDLIEYFKGKEGIQCVCWGPGCLSHYWNLRRERCVENVCYNTCTITAGALFYNFLFQLLFSFKCTRQYQITKEHKTHADSHSIPPAPTLSTILIQEQLYMYKWLHQSNNYEIHFQLPDKALFIYPHVSMQLIAPSGGHQ